jgi:hypothetical protein
VEISRAARLDPDEILRHNIPLIDPSLGGEHQWFRQRGQQLLAETRIDVEERRAGNRARAIFPGVVRTPCTTTSPGFRITSLSSRIRTSSPSITTT